MSKDRDRLDDALALSQSALALAEWARDLTTPAEEETQLLIAEAVVFLATRLTATATAIIDRCRPQGDHP